MLGALGQNGACTAPEAGLGPAMSSEAGWDKGGVLGSGGGARRCGGATWGWRYSSPGAAAVRVPEIPSTWRGFGVGPGMEREVKGEAKSPLLGRLGRAVGELWIVPARQPAACSLETYLPEVFPGIVE